MAECDKREDDAGNEQECLLSHEVPPFCKGVSSSFGGIVILRARKRGGTYTSGSSRSHVEAAKNDKTPEFKIPAICPKCGEPLPFCIDNFDVIDVLRCPNCDALFERGRFVCYGVKSEQTN
jgi:hypothetical protein